MRDDLLIVMAKAPVAGRVKTRLGMPPEAAAALARAFLLDLVDRHREAPYALEVALDGAAELPCPAFPQADGDLGDRLEAAAARGLERHRRVALIGSDLPHLSIGDVLAAFGALDRSDVAIGPSWDGGYYLLAMSRPLPLFGGMPWSSPELLDRTLEEVARLGLRATILPVRRDVDTPEDLETGRAELMTDATPRTRDVLRSLACACP